MTAKQYLQTRSTDYLRLLQELVEAPKTSGVIDLGYCKLVHACKVTTKTQTHAFASPEVAHAFILREFH